MIKATVVIPNWNGKKFLNICLPSLKEQTLKNFEIVIVDNGSDDESVSFIKSNFPECKIICFKENKGFSAAVNAGIMVARGEYIALLNNDIEAEENWLYELCNTLDKNEQIGFCASKMLRYYDRNFIDGVGDGYVRGGMAYKLGWAEKDQGQYNQAAYVFGACAGAACYRKKVFDDIGLFDEDFFAYLEDVDISFRAQLAGYRCLYVPTAIVYHMGSATTGSRFNNTTVYLSAKNYVNVLVKNLPAGLWRKDLYWIFRTLSVTFLKYIIRGRGFSLAKAYLSGLNAAFKQRAIMKAKRKTIQENIRVPEINIRQLMLISEAKIKASKQRKKGSVV